MNVWIRPRCFVITAFFLSFDSLGSNEVFFSPNGGCEQAVVHLITESKSQLDVAVYSINNASIVKALEVAKGRGVMVRVLTDRTQAAVNSAVTISLVEKGVDLRLHSAGRLMHNKFALFDGKKAVTGSFNWTRPGETLNEENCVVIDEESIVEKYRHRFIDHLWAVNTAEKSQSSLSKIKKRLSEKEVARQVKSNGD